MIHFGIAGNAKINWRFKMNNVYEYGGKHFIPHSKIGKIDSICDIKLRADIELGFFDSDWAGRRVKFKYSYKDNFSFIITPINLKFRYNVLTQYYMTFL